MKSDEGDRSAVAPPGSGDLQASDTPWFRRIVIGYLCVKAIVDVAAAILILSTQQGGELFGRSLSGSTALAVGDIVFGIFYVVFAFAIIHQWRRFALLAFPILIVDLLVSKNWGAPLVLLVLIVIPSTRRKLWWS